MSEQGNADAPALEDIVLALQKTFSRVSAATAEVPASQARALVVGQVDFEISLRAAPHDVDHLVQEENGPIQLVLKGRIDTDIRVSEDVEDSP